MSPDTAAPRTRRAILAAALGATAATVATALGRPAPALAGTDGDVVLGASNTATDVTRIENTDFLGTGLSVEGYSMGITGRGETFAGVYGYGASGMGVWGKSSTNYGVAAESDSYYGVFADTKATDRAAAIGRSRSDATGVYGVSGAGADPFPLAKPKTGVYGEANQDASARGVWGYSPLGRGVFGQAASGLGVRGYATSGVGLSGEATTGFALRTKGRLRFEGASGVATIAGGSASVTVKPGFDVTASSFVLLSPRANLGGRDLWHTVNATGDSFTIRLSSPVSTGLSIAWLLVG